MWYSHVVPDPIAENPRNLYRFRENLFWAVTDVRQYPIVPPKVCLKDYHLHPWRRAFSPAVEETATEAFNQLEALGKFNEYRTEHHNGYWDSQKYVGCPDP